MRVLVVNAGSSSLKLSVVGENDELILAESLPSPSGSVDANELQAAMERAGRLDAVGHRIVHGGSEFIEPVLIDERVVRRLHALSDLAPLHQPKSLHGLEIVSRVLPNVPAVACFDTAFHARMPEAAATYALPPEWRKRWDLRRFGFHGLSHAYASRRAAELAGREIEAFRVVTCHLGAGASLAAVAGGISVDTTMGFTPLEGLVMATRSGSIDPGLLLWLEEHVGMPPSELASTLEHRSGLLGLTGSADMRTILAAEAAGDRDAALAIDVYLHRLRAGIAAMTAAMDGLDALVFTGGVGERSAAVRERAAGGLSFLGVALDARANADPQLDAEIGAPGAGVRTFVIEAREDLQIARDVRGVLGTMR
ncbi:MAG TPA: acetate/propionate family kinase [Gaiellaceae bacterium]|nr:acetate/propionate family kinase [Gaiellaceae bacterium]